MCDAKISNKSYQELIFAIEANESSKQDLTSIKELYECSYCKKTYEWQSSLNNHLKVCNKKIDECKDTITYINSLEKRVQVLESFMKKYVIPKISFEFGPDTSPNIFGQEDTSFLNGDVGKYALKLSNGHTNLIKDIYFNNNYPQNQTVFHKSTKQQILWIFDGIKWIESDMNQVIEKILDKVYCIFTQYIATILKKEEHEQNSDMYAANKHWHEMVTSQNKNNRYKYRFHTAVQLQIKACSRDIAEQLQARASFT